MTSSDITTKQKHLCSKYGAPYLASPSELKIGISENIKDGVIPINGMRHRPEGDTTGWYIYGGEELKEDDDFFVPLHVEHLKSWNPIIEEFLGLAPGWRFLIAGDYIDVWYDESLLDI